MLFCLYLNFAFGTFKQTLDEFNSDPYSVYFLRNQENLHDWNKSSTPLLLYVPVPRTVLVIWLMIKFNVNRSNKCKVQFNEIRTSDTESVCYICLKKNPDVSIQETKQFLSYCLNTVHEHTLLGSKIAWQHGRSQVPRNSIPCIRPLLKAKFV